MKGDTISQQIKTKVLETLNDKSMDRSEAVFAAIDQVANAYHNDLVQKTQEEARRAAFDEAYKKSLGLRNLSEEETKFYEKLPNLRQTITASQADIIPTTIIDNTLAGLKEENDLFELINFAPAGVTNWLSASKSGAAAWATITESLTAELNAAFTSLKIDMYNLYVLLLIPKAITKLALPFVDRYFTAILREAMRDGIAAGFFDGDGAKGPIGIYRTIAAGHAARALSTAITNFSPKGLAPVKKALSNNGRRTVSKMYLVCNPADEADYVAPALYDKEGRMVSSFKNLTVIPDANHAQGKAAFVLPKMYTMGFDGIQITTYKETKALDNVDLVIASTLGNGMAADDNIAFPFDVTKLEEYVPSIVVANTILAPVNTKEVV